jgi:hypothetical protein
MPNRKIDRPVLVLVEGLDYLHLLRHQLARRPEWNGRVLLWDFKQNGLTLRQFLDVLPLQENFASVTALGVICDAEQDRAAMAASVRDLMRNHGLAVPDDPDAVGTGQPACSYLVIPHDAAAGCLEHACLAALARPELRPCAQTFLDCVGGARLNANWQAKLQVHAIIAGSGGNPAMTLGESSAAGVWDLDHPSLRVMIEFIEKLVRAG